MFFLIRRPVGGPDPNSDNKPPKSDIFHLVPLGVHFFRLSPFFCIFSVFGTAWGLSNSIRFRRFPRVRREARATGSSCFLWSLSPYYNGSSLIELH